ncbi:MAG: xanthine dehydrogenase family protein molybdopterin-binding subunit [Conexivisphaerales archaeon]
MSLTERLLIEGRGRFVDDIKLPGMMHLKIVRSPYARARITKVKGGINGHELKANLVSVGEGAGGRANVPFYVLSTDYVNFVGQPVAAVLAESREKAEDLADSVEVEYEPLKPIVDPEQALTAEPIHPGTSSNVFGAVELGSDFSVAEEHVEVERTLVNERIIPNPMETRGILANFDGGRLNIMMPTQSVYSIQRGLSAALGIPKESIHVVQTDTGGAFGTKGALYPEYVIAAYASMKYRRPIKWTETRSEHLVATNQGRGARGKVRIYSDKRGKIIGLKADILIDGGAYPVGNAEFSPNWIGYQITGPYAIGKVQVKARSVFTNKVPLGPYRGAGRPEAAFFIERTIDMLADELKMNPAEVRLANASDERFTSPLGLSVDPLKPFLQDALKTLGYEEKKNRYVGLSCFVLIPAAQPGESARLRVSRGVIDAWLGGSANGQGHDVFVAKLVSKELGVPESVVRYNRSDTDELDRGVGSWGSRSALLAGMAVVQAARELREQVKNKEGNYSPEALLRGEYDAKVFFQPSSPLTSLGVNLAEVKKDEENRRGFKIVECSAYYDVGVPLNPDMVVSQVIGGSAQAIGQVLYEASVLDENGQPLVASISDAGFPASVEIPEIQVHLATHPSSLEHGAKGVGESPTIGVPPALARAIERMTGKKVDRTPVGRDILLSVFE